MVQFHLFGSVRQTNLANPLVFERTLEFCNLSRPNVTLCHAEHRERECSGTSDIIDY